MNIDSADLGVHEGRAYRLLIKESDSRLNSLVYVPAHDTPGLSIDLIRVDMIEGPTAPLAQIIAAENAEYRNHLTGTTLDHRVVVDTPCNLVYETSFHHHPLLGSAHTAGRLATTEDGIYSLKWLRKLEPIPHQEASRRIEYVTQARIDCSALLRLSTLDDPFVASALEHSALIKQSLEQMLQQQEAPSEPLQLMESLRRASPLYHSLQWAAIVRLVAEHALDHGAFTHFAELRRMLGIGVLNLDDAGGSEPSSPLHSMFQHSLALLAELLLYPTRDEPHGEPLPISAQRAAGIWQYCAQQADGNDDHEASTLSAQAAFAHVVACEDIDPPLDAGFGPQIERGLNDPTTAVAMVDTLFPLSVRMAHIAHYSEDIDAVLRASSFAADLAQLILDRAEARGTFTGDAETNRLYLEKIVTISDWQLRSQMKLYGLSSDDIEGVNEPSATVSSSAQGGRIAYLRPLGSSRRVIMPHEFEHNKTISNAILRVLPAQLSLEAALHLALKASFLGYTLGGPLDVFGMVRQTAFGASADTWKMSATTMIENSQQIIVLASDSPGLAWELGEIMNQKALSKTVFVVPPDREGQPTTLDSQAAERLSSLGYSLPQVVETGFYVVSEGAKLEAHLPFEGLWDGRLRAALLARVGKRDQLG